jgi:hypothetical protein
LVCWREAQPFFTFWPGKKAKRQRLPFLSEAARYPEGVKGLGSGVTGKGLGVRARYRLRKSLNACERIRIAVNSKKYFKKGLGHLTHAHEKKNVIINIKNKEQRNKT